MIPFNRPCNTGFEEQFVLEAMRSNKISGDGEFSKKCENWFEKELPCKKAFLTPSCTHSLEMAAMLIGIKEGDEVIMPSYTFVSTANAFVLRGAKVVFIDIDPDTMNIDERLIESAITKKTKAIVPVHYAGVSCNMDKILEISKKYNLFVIEDSAQGMMSEYNGKKLGTIGHIGCYSFHETKNYTSGGEGGLLIINDKKFIEKAEILREKGTNRNSFFRGEIDKYTWIDIGSSYLPSELQSAYLYGQLLKSVEIYNSRMDSWNYYNKNLKVLSEKGYIKIPLIPKNYKHNAHIFYIKTKNLDIRDKLLSYLKENNIYGVFHYVPLHSSPAGKEHGEFYGEDKYTTKESQLLVRLPLWYGMKQDELEYIVSKVKEFYGEK